MYGKIAARDVTGTAYTLQTSDADHWVRTKSASVTTITVPKGSDVPFPTNTPIAIEQGGTGAVVIAAANGVTINRLAGRQPQIIGRYGVVQLVQSDLDVWTLFGGLS